MYSTEEYEALEQQQHELTVEEFAAILALLASTTLSINSDLVTFYNNYGTDGVVNYINSRKRVGKRDKRKRVNKLFSQIDDAFESYRLQAEVKMKAVLLKMIKTETNFYGVKLDVDELLNIKWGNDKLNWRTRLNNQVNQQSLKVKNRLKVAFIRGDSIDDLIDDLEIEYKKFERQLWSLYETEANAITSEARYRALKKKGFKKYRYYARMDERTCSVCGAMHNTKFPMSSFQIGVTAPPMHPHCRCWITELSG